MSQVDGGEDAVGIFTPSGLWCLGAKASKFAMRFGEERSHLC